MEFKPSPQTKLLSRSLLAAFGINSDDQPDTLKAVELAYQAVQKGATCVESGDKASQISPALAQTCRSSTDQVQGGLPADSESTAQLHSGPPPPSGQAKVATHHYQVRTTRLDTRPDLPPLYGPSSGRQPADSESNALLYRHVRTVITNSATRDNGQPPMPIRVVALPDLPLLNGPSPPQD